MCEAKHDFIFCTCPPDQLNTYTDTPSYIWYLIRYLRDEDKGMVGKIQAPSTDLGEGLTEATLQRLLEEGTHFDFEYIPAENDCFLVRKTNQNTSDGYISLLFRNGGWAPGMHDKFSVITERIAAGLIRPLP